MKKVKNLAGEGCGLYIEKSSHTEYTSAGYTLGVGYTRENTVLTSFKEHASFHVDYDNQRRSVLDRGILIISLLKDSVQKIQILGPSTSILIVIS